MPSWDFVSVVVAILALLVAIQPQIWILFSRLHRKLLIWKNPIIGTCQQLQWGDIRNNIHSHFGLAGYGPCRQCTLSMWQHVNVKLCWEKTVLLVFNKLNSRRALMKKPEQLPLVGSFMRTEPYVILAYLIATVRCNTFDISSYLQVQKQKSLIIWNLEQPNRILDLTKNEIERILDGWPPFYREHFTSAEGHILRSPITRYEHRRRPGWIVAVGLGLIQPTDICLDPESLKLPCDRVLDTLEGAFLETWPNNRDLCTAIRSIVCIQAELSLGYPKGLRRATLTSPNTIEYYCNISPLTKAQCEVAMQVFNTMSISEDQKVVMETNL